MTTVRKLHREHGREGPAHDPYGWEAITVEVNGVRYTLRSSALRDTQFSIDGCKVKCRDGAEACAWWERYTRMTPEQFERAYDRIKYRCSDHPRAGVRVESGYPGETFYTCRVCGKVISTHFNESAVM